MNKIILEDMNTLWQKSIVDWKQFNNSTVLITGANGMLASYITYMLIYLNEYCDINVNIIALCRNEKKVTKRFGEYTEKDYFTVCFDDIMSPLCISKKIDYIIHAASLASSQYYGTNPVDVILPNTVGNYNLLELAKKNNVKTYLFFSSGEIYGTLEKEVVMEDDSGYMNSMDIRNCYGESKRLGENMCKAYYQQYDIPTIIVRPTHTYGPTLDIEADQRVFSDFVSNIVENKDIELKSDGTGVRSFCYIADATLAFFLALLNGTPGEAYNISNTQGRISIKDLAEEMVLLYPDKDLKVIHSYQKSEYMENSHKIHSTFATDKIEAIGWTPTYTIPEGFKRTIDSFLLESN